MSQWIGEIILVLERKLPLIYLDLCVTLINLINLHKFITDTSLLVADAYGRLLERFAVNSKSPSANHSIFRGEKT